MDNPMGADVAADGGLFIVDKYNHRIRKISSNFPGFNVTDIAISSEDGAQIFRFNGKELHLNTMNALTKAVLYPKKSG